MIRFVFIVLALLLLVGAVWYLASRFVGRPVVGDTAGRILLAATIAAIAFWIFGGGALLGG